MSNVKRLVLTLVRPHCDLSQTCNRVVANFTKITAFKVAMNRSKNVCFKV